MIRDFAFAREIIDDHENAKFSKILLDHEDFVSGVSLSSFCYDFEQPLQNTENLKFLRENIYLPYMRFLYRKSLFKNVFDENSFICQRFSKFLLHILRQTRCVISQENISSTFEKL